MRKFLKVAFLICLALLTSLLISLAYLFYFLRTDSGQEWAVEKVATYFESQTDTEMVWGKLTFSFPFQVEIKNLVLSQQDVPLLKIKEAKLSFGCGALWNGRWVCSEFKMDGVDLFKNPMNSSEIAIQREGAGSFPLLPFYVKIEQIDIQNLRIHPSFLETFSLSPDWADKIVHSLWHLKGMIRNHPLKQDLSAHLLLTIQHNDFPSPLSFAIDMQNDQLSCSSHLDLVFLQQMDPYFPENLKGHLALYTTASIDTWHDLWKKDFPLVSPIAGHFKFSLDPSKTPSLLPTQIISRYRFNSLESLELFETKLLSPFFFLEGQTTLNLQQQTHQGTFKGSIPSLALLFPHLEKEISGNLTLEGSTQGNWQAPALFLHLQSPHLQVRGERIDNIQSALEVSLEAHKKAGFLSLSCHYQQMPWQITSPFEWTSDQSLALPQLQIKGQHANIQGKLLYSLQDGIKEGAFNVQLGNLKDISPFLPLPFPIEGEAQLQLDLLSSREEQRWQGRLIGSHLKGGDWQAEELTWEGEIPLSNKETSSKLFGKGIQSSKHQITIREFFADLIHSFAINPFSLSSLKGQWKASDLQKENMKAAYAYGQGKILHPFKPLAEGDLEIYMQALTAPSMQAEHLKFATHFHPNHSFSPFLLQGKGLFKEAWELAIEGKWKWEDEYGECRVDALKGHWGPYPLAIQQPLVFLKEAKDKHFARLNLLWGEAAVQAEFKQEGERFSSQFKTNAIPSELFHFVAPNHPLSGRATFSGHFNGTWQQPEGAIDIQLHRIQVMEDFLANKPFIEGSIHLNMDQGRSIRVHSTLSGIGKTPVIVSGTLPLRLPHHFSFPELDTALPFHLTINAEGLLDPYVHLFYEDIKSLSGRAKIALEIMGNMKAPQVKGKISVWNGIYESLSTGASYHHIEAILEGTGSEMVLTHFSAQDKAGTLTGTGKVDLNWRKHLPFTFDLHCSNVLIIDSDYALLAANGPLTLVGNLKKSKLTGTLSIQRAEINLGESLPRPLKTVDVQYINIPEGELISVNKKTSSSLEFDLKLQANHVLIQGKRLFSEWKGEINVLGSPKTPLMYGELRLARGEFDLNGKPLTLSQGTIHFAGDPRKKTTLYVVASKEINPRFSESINQETFNQAFLPKNIDHIHAEIIVKGPINRPAISFRSTPPLSQREVLSYILFNRGISDITADQGDLLSQSFISLNSSETKSDSDDFLSRIRNNMGLDRLDLITGDTQNPDLGLQVGKYLTPNVLVSINHSMNTLTPVVAIEAKLKKHWKAQAESGLGGDNNPVRFSLKWKKDY